MLPSNSLLTISQDLRDPPNIISSSAELPSHTPGVTPLADHPLQGHAETESRIPEEFEVLSAGSSAARGYTPDYPSRTPKSENPKKAPLGAELLLIAALSAYGTLVRQGFLFFTKRTPGWGFASLPLFDALWPNFVGSVLSAIFLPLPKILEHTHEGRRRRNRVHFRARSRGGGGGRGKQKTRRGRGDEITAPRAKGTSGFTASALDASRSILIIPRGGGRSRSGALSSHVSASDCLQERRGPSAKTDDGVLFPLLLAIPAGLSKGFCASLTTFSSWILVLLQAVCEDPDAAAQKALPELPYSRANRLIWVFLFGLSTPVFAFHLGSDAGLLLQRLVLRQRPRLWTFADVLRESRELEEEDGSRRRERHRGHESGQRDGLREELAASHEGRSGMQNTHLQGTSAELQSCHGPEKQNSHEAWISVCERKTTPFGGTGPFLTRTLWQEAAEGARGKARFVHPAPSAAASSMGEEGRGRDAPALQPSVPFYPTPLAARGSADASVSVHILGENEQGRAAPSKGQRGREGERHHAGRRGGSSDQTERDRNRKRTLSDGARNAFERFAGSTSGERRATLIIGIFACLTYALFSLMATFDQDSTRQKWLWYPPLLSFLGSWLRYIMSLQLDVYTPYFPMGTFLSNVIASVLVAGVEEIVRRDYPECRGPSSARQPTKCAMTSYCLIEAVAYGVCSSLSTMSTFIAELSILPKRYAYRYGLLTVICAFFFSLAVYLPLR
ncbi:CrcB family protein [Besnoitia besnoiti]|uniref:CrcB family protein n=1 Tax=Besnoitia besnoiti TaxID=94643 RepID=A0A2A9MJS7_BESBE|nr:CrcB family protein [Besnoitia besnoiti]PFH35642.1 CrcB family protein [Besnoitia besnoiti]